MVKITFFLFFIFSLSRWASSSEHSLREEETSIRLVKPQKKIENVSSFYIFPLKEEPPSSAICSFKPFTCWRELFSFFYEQPEKEVKTITSLYQERLIFLPPEIHFHIASFLSSRDILRLSATCTYLRSIFNEDYWNFYLSQLPEAYSYLLKSGPISFSTNKEIFFAHLWYREGYLNLAKELHHPEAIIIFKYSPYGVSLNKDHYFCPSGVIKYFTSGEIDQQATTKLKQAKEEEKRKNTPFSLFSFLYLSHSYSF